MGREQDIRKTIELENEEGHFKRKLSIPLTKLDRYQYNH